MKSRIAGVCVAVALFCIASSASAFEFLGGCGCEAAPSCQPTCCVKMKKCRCHHNRCCQPSCCEAAPSCGAAAPTCAAAAPTCAAPAPTCAAAAPTCGCDAAPTCGCENSCNSCCKQKCCKQRCCKQKCCKVKCCKQRCHHNRCCKPVCCNAAPVCGGCGCGLSVTNHKRPPTAYSTAAADPPVTHKKPSVARSRAFFVGLRWNERALKTTHRHRSQ